MKKIGVICDWDNFLVPTHHTWLQANQVTLGEYGKEIDEETFIKTVFGTDVALLLETVGLDTRLAETIQRQRNDMYSTMLSGIEWIEGAEDFLIAVQYRDIPMGVVSHARRQNIDALAHLGYDSFFRREAFLCQDNLDGKKKPHPFGLLTVAQRLEIEPQNCVYMGDLGTDMEAARNAGMKGILIPNQLTEPDAHEIAWKVFPDFHKCREQIDEWLKEI